MLKVIVSAPAVLFASVIAWRSEPAPLSFVLITVKMAALDEPTANKSSRMGQRKRGIMPPFLAAAEAPGNFQLRRRTDFLVRRRLTAAKYRLRPGRCR